MENKKIICTSCKTSITNIKGSVELDCPNCGNLKLVRCYKCRELGTNILAQHVIFQDQTNGSSINNIKNNAKEPKSRSF